MSEEGTTDLTLPDKLVVLHERLEAAGLPHAFGGALALAFCTRQARGTNDIDVNLFVGTDRAAEVLDVLAPLVPATGPDLGRLRRDGQVRLWWGRHPVDVFLDTTEFHEHLPRGVQTETFHSATLPFLGCGDLAVFKAFFDRSKNWVDIEEMLLAGTIDVASVLGTLVRHLGGADPRVERLRAVAADVDGR